MKIPIKDRSNYLKGLLIVAKKDNKLAETEKTILKDFALKLGFASDFYNETIMNLLSNKYIDEALTVENPNINLNYNEYKGADLYISNDIYDYDLDFEMALCLYK